MQLSEPHEYAQKLRSLRQHMEIAAAAVYRSDWTAAWAKAISWVSLITAITGVFVAVQVGIARLMGSNIAQMALLTAVVGVTTALAAIGAALLRQRRPTLAEVAERLDMAVKNQNAIATAVYLARDGRKSCCFTERAIADGITSAKKFGAAQPSFSPIDYQKNRNAAYLGIGFCAVAISLFMPIADRSRRSQVAIAYPSLAGSAGKVASDDHRVPAIATEKRVVIEPTSKLSPSTGASSQEKKPSGSSSDQSAASSSDSSAESSSASSNPSRNSPSAYQPVAKEQFSESHTGTQKKSDSGDHLVQHASFGSASSDAAQSQDSPRGGMGSDSVSNAKQSTSTSRSDQNGTGGKVGVTSSTPSAESDGQGNNASKSDKKGQGAGQSQESSNGSGGNGRGGGQNPPKKSRGVAPLMLSSLQPDLLQATQLSGPDERTRLQVPPRPDPQLPAEPAAASPRHDDEVPVDVYQVSASDRQAVADYFHQYHEDAENLASPVATPAPSK